MGLFVTVESFVTLESFVTVATPAAAAMRARSSPGKYNGPVCPQAASKTVAVTVMASARGQRDFGCEFGDFTVIDFTVINFTVSDFTVTSAAL